MTRNTKKKTENELEQRMLRAIEEEPKVHVFPVSVWQENGKWKKAPAWNNADLSEALGREIKPGEGGHNIATRNPEVIRILAQRGNEVGLHLKLSRLAVADMDDYKDPDGIEAWAEETGVADDIRRARVRTVKTPSGGRHAYYRVEDVEPQGDPRPGVELKYNGWVVWPGDLYSLSNDVPLSDTAVLSEEIVKVREKRKGRKTGKVLLSEEECDDAFRTNGEFETRHEAMRDKTTHIMRRDPDQTLRQCAEKVAAEIEALMPPGPRRDELTEIRISAEGAGSDSELVRAIRPLMPNGTKRNLVQGGDVAQDRLADALAKFGTNVTPFTPALRRDVTARRKRNEMASKVEAGDAGWEDLSRSQKRHVKKVVEEQQARGELFTPGELRERKTPLREWALPGFFPRRGISIVSGRSGTHKSRWLNGVALGMMTKTTECLGLPKVKDEHCILWFGNEEDRDDIIRRSKVAVEHLDLPDGGAFRIVGVDDDGVKRLIGDDRTENTKEVDKMIREAKEMAATVIVYDPTASLGIDNENAAGDIARLIAVLTRIANEADCCVIIVHHAGKGDGDISGDADAALRGSSAFKAGVYSVITVDNCLPTWFYDKSDRDRRKTMKAIREAWFSGDLPQYIEVMGGKSKGTKGIAPIVYKPVEVEIGRDPETGWIETEAYLVHATQGEMAGAYEAMKDAAKKPEPESDAMPQREVVKFLGSFIAKKGVGEHKMTPALFNRFGIVGSEMNKAGIKKFRAATQGIETRVGDYVVKVEMLTGKGLFIIVENGEYIQTAAEDT